MGSTFILAAFTAFALSFCIFVLVGTRIASEPILPLHLLLNRTVASICMTNSFINMIVSCVMYYVPIDFRIRGRSATKAGAILIPLSITFASESFLTGFTINKIGKYKQLIIPNLLFILVAAISLHRLTLYTALWLPRVYVGLAYGDMLMICLMALVGSAKRGDQAVATSLSSAFRSTGSVMGVTTASTVFQNFSGGTCGIAWAIKTTPSKRSVESDKALTSCEICHAWISSWQEIAICLLSAWCS